MNRTIIALGLLACSTHIAAQDVNIYTPGTDEGIVYFLPKTALEVNIIATRISYQPGELCQYANRYLRMNNVNPQPETYWEIKQIDVRSIGVPDSTKAYIIKLKDKSTLSNIELTESGIAKAINTTFPKEYEQQQGYELEKPLPHESTRKYMTEEILMAGSTRIRPVLMTSLTTILGLIVMAVGKTAGTDMMQPLALVCIGGLVYATALTLLVVPVMYDIFNGEVYKVVKNEDIDISDLVVE